MSTGNENAPPPAARLTAETIPDAYLSFAAWLLSRPDVIEALVVVSDLPQVATTRTTIELDSGVWFVCRVAGPPMPETAVALIREGGTA